MKQIQAKKDSSITGTLENTGNVTYKNTQAVREVLAGIALNKTDTTDNRLTAATLYLESLGIISPPIRVLA